MIAIIKWEIARRKIFLLWWTAGVVALVALLLLIYPSIHAQAAQLDQVFKTLPQSVRGLRGGDTDITSPVGYLNAEVFYITLPLILIILAVNLGSGLLAKDEQDHTLELLLARPVSRGAALAGKAIAGLVLILTVGLAATVTTALMSRLVNLDIGLGRLLLTSALTVVFATSFGAITYALSAASVVSRRIGVTLAVAASFGGYLMESLGSASDFVKNVAKALPYHYFTPRDMLNGRIDRGFVIYMSVIFVAAALISYLGFRRRDVS